uniref:Putative iron-sulfur cluster-binding domain contining protein n=1 Tax=viral metagenome TaxID=1070528 RepID=A0A6M3IJL0_9ZZZZ
MDYFDNENLIHSFANIRSLQIQTIDYCNRKCPWCPNAHMEKDPGNRMSYETLDRILSELQSVNYDGRIHLYLLEEPLCDDRIVEITGIVRERFPNNVIYLSTNGDYLDTKIMVKDLFNAGLSEMSVMHYDKANVGRLQKYSGDPRIALINKDEMGDCWYNRGGNVDVTCDFPVEFCEWVLQKLYIRLNGDVILCCSDYNYEVVYGNLMKQGLMDIWLSPKYKIYRIAHYFKHGHELALCGQCNRLKRKEVVSGAVRKRWSFFRPSSAV